MPSDKERVDWLMNAQNGRSCGYYAHNGRYFIGGLRKDYATPRRAIDAAIRASRKGGKRK